MAPEPTAWAQENKTNNSWYEEAPEFALYNTDKLYDADLPYDIDVTVKAADWDAINAIATSWSQA